MTRKQLLTDMDIQNIRTYCFKFGELYPVFFPEKPCLTRKIHELVFHLPRFVELHKTVGLFSEEEGETLHKVVNQHNASWHMRSCSKATNTASAFRDRWLR